PVPTGLTEDRFVKAVETKEVWLTKDGQIREFKWSRAIVHHAAVHTGPSEILDEGPAGNTQGVGNGQLRITYEIGQNAQTYSDNTGTVVKAGNVMLFAFHLHANGEETLARVDVGLQFYPKGYKPKYLQSGFEVLGQLHDELEIPPNQDNIRFDSFYRF